MAAQGDKQAASKDFAAALKALPQLQRNDLLVAELLDAYADLLIDGQNEKLHRQVHQRAAEIQVGIAAAG